jgi:hypothetical protein
VGTVEHAISIAEKVIGTTPAIERIVTAHGVLVHLEGIAVKSIVAVSTIEGVVPAVSVALHNHGIAVEDVVTSKAIDGLRSSSVGQRATGVAKQAIGTWRSIDGVSFRHSDLQAVIAAAASLLRPSRAEQNFEEMWDSPRSRNVMADQAIAVLFLGDNDLVIVAI